MNQLRRMVLVNSANVGYREIELDGHIHFIGTQGTGKSTLLRALLFFYNADQRKLGISKEKKAFAEFYFPFADSYIFYEVQAGARRFCVWLYKRQNRLCFRFVDGAYDRDAVIEGTAARSEGELLAQLSSQGVKVERPIYSLTDYRDILYGENRAFRRYALMRSSSNYSTIPRTISNIFLNANLDGDYIKKTIIDSLSEESVEINLEANRHHLETARSHYADVVQYQRCESQAEQILMHYAAIQELESRQRDAAWSIGAAANRAREQARILEEQEAEYAEAERVQFEKLKTVQGRFETEKRRLGDQLAVIKKNISRANKLKRDYAEKGIENLLAAAKEAPHLEHDLSIREQQLRALTARVEQQEQQFEIAEQKVRNSCGERIQKLFSKLHEEKDCARGELDQARAALDQQTVAVEAEFAENVGSFQQEKEDVTQSLRELDFKLRELDQARFFEAERNELEERKKELEQELIRTEARQRQIKEAVQSLQREAEDRQKIAEAEGADALRPLLDARRMAQERLTEHKRELEALHGSLVEFLDEQVEGWEETIGKVVRRDVLLHSGLAPQKTNGQSLYGIALKMEHLESVPLSKNELETAIASTEKECAELSARIEKQLAENQAGLDRQLQKYNRLIREKQDEGKAATARYFQCERDLERSVVAQQALEERVAAKRRQEQAALEEQGHKLRGQQQELEAMIQNLTGKRDASLKRLDSDFKRRKKAIEKELNLLEAETEEQRANQNQQMEDQLAALRTEREQLLKSEGVDAEKVAELEREVQRLRQKLEEIKQQAPTLIEYAKDRREWIDRLEEFQRERGQIENRLQHQTHLFERRIQQDQERLHEVKARLAEIRSDRQTMKDELVAFEAFERDELFAGFESFILHNDLSESANCLEWIDELKTLAWKFEKQFKQLTERITAFAGLFSEGNCLGFEVHLSGEASFRAFADGLEEFVREQKIITLKTEVTRKYSMVLETLVTETNRLLQREDEVYQVIQKINRDFRTSNFVGVVRSIEMRLQQSTNRIFQVLREICRFQNENHMSFGELDLFNQGNSGNDEKAVKLLDELRLQMGQAKSTTLKLEDALDLEFRVCENENDTSWVSRLANVGSNGTDVLVKSMIYINLLNIFKSGSRKQDEPAVLHCLVDEVGILHDSNVSSLIKFAAERGICMINGSPNSHNEQDYKHIYIFRKDRENKTEITKLISHAS
ncbi:ATP-binding protein [Verrucomicrobia bacterium S94]|nr:ATP-binding protein [Verrucomicrobia bacterium S94]